jgi:hypothetical protein
MSLVEMLEAGEDLMEETMTVEEAPEQPMIPLQ